VYAVFDDKVDMFKGTTMAGIIEDEAVFDPKRGFAGGYHMETVSLGSPFHAAFLDPGAWGPKFTQAMDEYAYTAGMWIVGEDMPRATNRVTLNSDVKDQYGQPVANVHFDDHPNDEAMREHAFTQGSAVYAAAGAKTVYRVPPYSFGYGQTHDVPNLFVSDGSQFTTGAAENPTLTIVTLAIRQADYITGQMSKRSI
jgi:hypothetical protein